MKGRACQTLAALPRARPTGLARPPEDEPAGPGATRHAARGTDHGAAAAAAPGMVPSADPPARHRAPPRRAGPHPSSLPFATGLAGHRLLSGYRLPPGNSRRETGPPPRPLQRCGRRRPGSGGSTASPPPPVLATGQTPNGASSQDRLGPGCPRHYRALLCSPSRHWHTATSGSPQAGPGLQRRHARM